MSDADNQAPISLRPAVWSRLRVAPWDAKISAHVELKLFCGPDDFRFLDPGAQPTTAPTQASDNRSTHPSEHV